MKGPLPEYEPLVQQQRREIDAIRNVVRQVRLLCPSKRYSVRALALMTIGRGALISALANAPR